MAPGTRDPRVDDYIAGLPDWQQEICREVREIAHAADPGMQETIKRSVLPYFLLDGNVCALQGTRHHVNVFLYDGGMVADPHGIITDGHDNSTGRQIKIRQGDPIDAPALRAMLARIAADNRAGGWRRLKAAGVAADRR